MTEPIVLEESGYRAACGVHRTGLAGVLDGLRDQLQSGVVAAAMAKILQIRHPGSIWAASCSPAPWC